MSLGRSVRHRDSQPLFLFWLRSLFNLVPGPRQRPGHSERSGRREAPLLSFPCLPSGAVSPLVAMALCSGRPAVGLVLSDVCFLGLVNAVRCCCQGKGVARCPQVRGHCVHDCRRAGGRGAAFTVVAAPTQDTWAFWT